MGNQTQIALSNGQARKKVSSRRNRKSATGTATPAKDARPDAKADKETAATPLAIRPAFLPELEKKDREAAERGDDLETVDQDTENKNEKSSEYADKDADSVGEEKAVKGKAAEGSAVAVSAETETESDVAATGKDDTGTGDEPILLGDALEVTDKEEPIATQVTDPELLQLLEQLSQTLDTANQVLSENPIKLGDIRDEYAGISEPAPEPEPEPETEPEPLAAAGPVPLPPPAPTKMIKRPRRISVTPGMAAMFASLFLATAGGSYFWFKANPWLQDGQVIKDIASLAPGKLAVEKGSTAQANLIAPATGLPGTPPLPVRKPAQDRLASLDAGTPARLDTPAPVAAPTPLTTPATETPPAATAAELPEGAQGVAGQAVPLRIKVPAQAGQEEVSIMIQGVPDAVQLSAGNKIGGGTWILTDGEAQNLTLTAPEDFPAQQFELEVALVKSDGKIPESRKIGVNIEASDGIPMPPSDTSTAAITTTLPEATAKVAPAPAPTPAPKAMAISRVPDKGEPEEKTETLTAKKPEPKEPAVSIIPAEEEARLLERAEALLELSDVASARLLLEHAARRGSTKAMQLLGKTYDPDHLASLGVRGVTGDKSQATAWYERASRKADR